MANSFLPFQNPTTTNEKLDTEELAVGANDVHRERVQIAGAADTAIAPVTAADGLLVNLGANNDVTVTGTVAVSSAPVTVVTGPLTDTQLRATPVPISGTVAVTEPVTVDAVNLDIRDLAFASDKVDASGSTGVGVTGTFFQATQPISAATLPLPTGAATAALQLPNSHDVTVDNASGAAAVNIQDGGNSITVDGTVAISTLPASTNTLEVVGDVAHDAPAAGNPVLIAASSETMADSAPANRVSADGDATRISATDGAVYVIPTGPQTWSYHENSSSALTDASVHAAPGAGLSLYVTSIIFSTGAATAWNIFFEEGAATVLGPWYLEAVAGRGAVIYFATPKKITANTALTVTTSAAIAHSIDVTGFIAAG